MIDNKQMNVINQDKFYQISCSDWSMILKSSSKYEAGCLSLKEMIKGKGSNLNLSFTIEVKEVNDENNIEFFYVPTLLFDLGHFKLSEDLSSLRHFFLDKGKNSY